MGPFLREGGRDHSNQLVLVMVGFLITVPGPSPQPWVWGCCLPQATDNNTEGPRGRARIPAQGWLTPKRCSELGTAMMSPNWMVSPGGTLPPPSPIPQPCTVREHSRCKWTTRGGVAGQVRGTPRWGDLLLPLQPLPALCLLPPSLGGKVTWENVKQRDDGTFHPPHL